MKYKIFLVLFVLSLISAIVLSTHASSVICAPGQGCDTVNNSSYGSTLGVKNSVYGIFIFSFMILLTLFHIMNPNEHTRRIIHASVIIGSAIALYFLYLQFVVIKAICDFCLVVDLGLLVAFGFMIWLWDH